MCKDQILDFARVDPKNKIQISRKKYSTELVLKFLNILSTKKYLKPKNSQNHSFRNELLCKELLWTIGISTST